MGRKPDFHHNGSKTIRSRGVRQVKAALACNKYMYSVTIITAQQKHQFCTAVKTSSQCCTRGEVIVIHQPQSETPRCNTENVPSRG